MIAWYFRLFYIPILSFILAYLLAALINPKRMGGPELSKPWMAVYLISFGGMCVLMWFVPFSINSAFWIGICIVVFGHLVNGIFFNKEVINYGKIGFEDKDCSAMDLYGGGYVGPRCVVCV